MFGNASLLVVGLACTGNALWDSAAARPQELPLADIEQKVALTLLQTRALVLEKSNDTAMSSKVPWLTHSSGAVLFLQRTLEEGAAAWADRTVYAYYTGVPEELAGSVFFAGPAGGLPPGNLSLSSPMAGWAYIWGSPPGADFVADERWERVGVMEVGSGSLVSDESRQMVIFRTDFSAGTSLKVPVEVENPWVVGVAFKRAMLDDVGVLALAATGQGSDASDIDGFFTAALKQLVSKLTFNCNTAAFILALVMLVSLAFGFLFCWGDVESLINKRNFKP